MFLSLQPKNAVLLSWEKMQQFKGFFVNFKMDFFFSVEISKSIPQQSLLEVIIKFESFDISRSVIVALWPFKKIFSVGKKFLFS